MMTMPPRDPLALAMFAAWVNCPVDQLPDTMRAHTCPATMEAWKRVGEAAFAYYRERNQPMTDDRKLMITATAYVDNETLKDSTGARIEWKTESSTDLPADALGEATALALGTAWRSGIDPAATRGFHIRVSFS